MYKFAKINIFTLQNQFYDFPIVFPKYLFETYLQKKNLLLTETYFYKSLEL